MNTLGKQDLANLSVQRRNIRYGWHLTQAELDRLVEEWRLRCQPDGSDEAERFAITRADGASTGVIGPRWIFHLLGLAHRAAHVGLTTESGLVVLQRRSHAKRDWPGAWDMAVAGHVAVASDGKPMSYLDGAWMEAEEEIGLSFLAREVHLVEQDLQPLGSPYFSYDESTDRNPPFHNAEVRALFRATLTQRGLAALRPCPEELAGIYLCTPDQAWSVLAHDPVASGLRYSGPLFLGWLARAS